MGENGKSQSWFLATCMLCPFEEEPPNVNIIYIWKMEIWIIFSFICRVQQK